MLSYPSVNGVRLATLDDLDRISIVAAAAFFWSPTFRFQRPHYKEFPADTVASYRTEYEAAINDPTYVVLVAEGVLEVGEVEHMYEALRTTYQPPRLGQKGIVGVCSLKLKPNSPYTGQLQPASSRSPPTQRTSHILVRDQCAEARKVYENVTGPPKLKYLADKMRLGSLGVSPMYWRRGHATRLVSFCTQLADMDDALVGVSATPSGSRVTVSAGFEECETVRIKRLAMHEERAREDPPDAADVVLWIGVRLPSSRPSSSGKTSRSESSTDVE
ncbi:hypothetical protein GQ44DRAFT_624209 [Phaeosphaeriaceae sp. PMI808]|nr:hypothetical protein GQ44DRAFT_624209 [Phaeosphaeriaceae sp. PMI808]